MHKCKASLVKGKVLSYDYVMHLLDTPLLSKGYKVYVEISTLAQTLFGDLLDKKTSACGTVHPSRQGFSQDQK